MVGGEQPLGTGHVNNTTNEGFDIVFRLSLLLGDRELKTFGEFTVHLTGPLDDIDMERIIEDMVANIEATRVPVHSFSSKTCTRENQR